MTEHDKSRDTTMHHEIPHHALPNAKAFHAIAAMSTNRVIGNGTQIPWHLPEDFAWFKEKTVGHILVMGRTTFESIGRPLPKRETIVLSRSGFAFPGVRTIQSLDEIDVNADERTVFIAGGAQVYALAMSRCSDLFLTHVLRTVQGDVLLPPFESMFDDGTLVRETPDFRVMHYRRRA